MADQPALLRPDDHADRAPDSAAVVVPTDVVPPLPEEQPANPTATSPATTPRDVRMRALV